MTSENTLFAIELQMYGIVCLKILFLHPLSTLLKIDSINSGTHRNLNIRNWQVEITGTGSRSLVF